MRTATFLLISLALHATVLSYPVFFLGSRPEPLVPVVILISSESSEGIRAGNGGTGASRRSPSRPRPPEAVRGALASGEVTTPKREEPKLESGTVDTPLQSEILVASNEAAVVSHAMQNQGMLNPGLPGVRLTGGAGEGPDSGNGVTGGIGYGNGIGSGNGARGIALVGVSYAYNPTPEYPERARREGREGTVLLRVLVDEEGGSRLLEVNRSSGFEPLDKAAVETVRRWRFHPARYGDKRVEAWVNVPIIFRLTDLHN